MNARIIGPTIRRAIAVGAIAFSFTAVDRFATALAEDKPMADEQQRQEEDEFDDLDKLREIELTIHPAKIAKPALQYVLLPPLRDRVEGNAAPIYCRAALFRSQDEQMQDIDYGKRSKKSEKIHKWLDRPISKLPRKKARQLLDEYRRPLHELDLAARRNRCVWESNSEDDVVSPEIFPLMSLSDALALRARLEIADGEFDDALRTIQTGYALSRHIGSEGTIIVGLIGSLIESKATDQLTALIASPGAPNLYWAIVDLPKPLIDVRRMFEVESEYIYRLLPQLSDAKTKELPEQTWDEMLVAVLEKLNESPVLPDGDEDESDKSLRESNIRAKAGQAREDLIALGRGKDEVAAMCDSRAILLHAALTYESWRDELFKAVNLPYVDARRIVEQTTKRAEKEAAKSEIIPLASTALPIMVGTLPPIARNHRKLEMLRIIEALRAFAAENEGKFPKSLDEIKDLPIPTNPMTGKPFGYRIEGDRAILEAVDEHDFRPVRYLLRSANSAE